MQFFARERESTSECFDLIINELMSGPFCFAGAIPEVDFVPAFLSKVGFNSRGYWNKHILKRVDFRLQDFSCCRDGIGDDDNIMDIIHFHGGFETSAYCHEFSLN